MAMSASSLRRFLHLHHILLAAGVLLVVLVAAIVTSGIIWLRERTLQDAEVRMNQLALVIAEQTERALESVDGVTQIAAARVRQGGLDDPQVRARLHAYLNQQAANLPQSRSFLVTDRNGNRIVDSEYEVPRAQNMSGGEGFRHFHDDPTATGVHLGPPARSRQTGEWYFALSRRVDAPDGTFDGLVSASIDMSYFTNFFKSVSLGEGAAVSLVRLDGIQLLRYPVIESFLGKSFANGRIHKEYLPHTKSGTVREVIPMLDGERMYSFRVLKQYPVVIIVGNSIRELLTPWRIQAWGLGAFGVLAILGLTVFGALLIRLARREEALLAEAREARNAAELATKGVERASRAKSEFLAGISHDLRTPLNSIIGFSEIMRDGIGGPLQPKSREYVGFIHTAGQHLLSLINNLLDLAKVEANRLTILDDQFALHGVVGECLNLVAAQAEAGRVTLLPYAERELGLKADPVRVRQILFNLLSNGIKFTPPGGTVEVRTARADDGGLRLSVVDTGIGMTEAEIATAMQEYGQVVNSYTREREGTGLGLPLVKALIELHGGRLEITSVPKKGTTATVVFPAERVLSQKDTGTRAA